MRDLFRNITFDCKYRRLRIVADKDPEQSYLASHVIAFEVLEKKGEEVRHLGSVDPHQDRIEYRTRLPVDAGNYFMVAVKIKEPSSIEELVPVSDWTKVDD